MDRSARNLKQIEAREAAYQKLVDAEKFVDTFESLHSETMAKDGDENYDQSPVEGVVRKDSGSGNTLESTLASNINDAPHLKHTKWHSSTTTDHYNRRYTKAGMEELKMETNSKRDRTTYTRTTVDDYHINSNANLREVEFQKNSLKTETIIVTGSDENREFSFGEIGMLQSAWESLSDLASGFGRTLAPIKSYIPVSVSFKK
jgi:hypothetical protein